MFKTATVLCSLNLVILFNVSIIIIEIVYIFKTGSYLQGERRLKRCENSFCIQSSEYEKSEHEHSDTEPYTFNEYSKFMKQFYRQKTLSSKNISSTIVKPSGHSLRDIPRFSGKQSFVISAVS